MPKTADKAPVALTAPVPCRPQLGRKIGDAIETGCDGQHLLLRPRIGDRFAEGAHSLGVPEPELGIVQGGLHVIVARY